MTLEEALVFWVFPGLLWMALAGFGYVTWRRRRRERSEAELNHQLELIENLKNLKAYSKTRDPLPQGFAIPKPKGDYRN